MPTVAAIGYPVACVSGFDEVPVIDATNLIRGERSEGFGSKTSASSSPSRRPTRRPFFYRMAPPEGL